jgi:hypothetical protein
MTDCLTPNPILGRSTHFAVETSASQYNTAIVTEVSCNIHLYLPYRKNTSFTRGLLLRAKRRYGQ